MEEEPEYDEIADVSMGAPHVVILGAGASLASLPDRDRNGRKLPLMMDLIETCGLSNILDQSGIAHSGVNFEEIYSDLHQSGNDKLLGDVEDTVFKYFSQMQLPDHPTIYDLLVVSLRQKDLIATFNWDPLLWQAFARNDSWAKGPQAVFLHGNTAIGYCLEHRKVGPRGGRCRGCGITYSNAKLLYPIKTKDYANDPYIRSAWDILKEYLKHAYLLTVFGYGAPESDVEAIQLMKEGWGPVSGKSLAQTEIIDVKDEDELRQKWEPFIHTHHYEIHRSFFDSIMARHPRRSCEAMWAQFMEGEFLDDYRIPETSDWQELREWFTPRIEAEKTKKAEE